MKTKDYIEYSLTKKQHKEIFPYEKFYYGLVKYKYFATDYSIIVERYYRWIVLIFMLAGFLISFPWYGIKNSWESLQDLKYIFKNKPFISQYYHKFYDIPKNGRKKTRVAELFEKYAIRKK